jgi:hypothetical protein
MNPRSFQRAGALLAVVAMASTANAEPPKVFKPDLVCEVSVTLPSGRTVTNGETIELVGDTQLIGTAHWAVRNRGLATAGATQAFHYWSFVRAGGPASAGGGWVDNIPQLGSRTLNQLPDSQITIRSDGSYFAGAAVDGSNKVNEEDENNNTCDVTFIVKHVKVQLAPAQPK